METDRKVGKSSVCLLASNRSYRQPIITDLVACGRGKVGFARRGSMRCDRVWGVFYESKFRERSDA